MRVKLSTFFLIILSSALAMAISSPAQAQTSHTNVFTFMTPNPNVPADGKTVGWARLHRSSDGARLTLKTTELTPYAGYSIWWVIFNNPEACGDDGCSDADFGNPAVEASVLNATGRVANDYGKAQFNAFLPTGFIHTEPASGNIRHAFGPGLQNPRSAEIHVVVRCHGLTAVDMPPPPFTPIEQISTLNGDCNVPGFDMAGNPALVCFDAQAAVFPLPRRRHKRYDD